MNLTDVYPENITSMMKLVARAKEKFGDKTYLIASEPDLDDLSYAQLYDFCAKFGAFLDEKGVKEDEAVGTVFHNSSLLALLFIAVIANNRVFVPMNPKMGEAEIAHICNLCDPVLTIYGAEFGSRVDNVEKAGALEPIKNEIAFIKEIFARTDGSVPADRPDVDYDRPAEVVFTSGSTGLPKGAVLTHRNLLKNAFSMAMVYEFEEGTSCLTACPLFHNSGQLFTALATVWSGGKHVAVRSDLAMLKFWHLCDQYEVEWSLVMNAFLSLLVQRPEMPKKGTLKGVLSGGSKLKLDLVDSFEAKFGVPVYQVFGLTETTSISTGERPNRSEAGRGSAGMPLPGCHIKIVMDGEVKGRNEEGEILISGEHIFREYIKQPDVTAEKMDDGWLHSGDLGYVDDEGNVFIVDRLDSMIHVGGENVYPSEIENLSTLLPGVEDVIVTAIPNKILGAELIMVYKSQEGVDVDPPSWTEIFVQHLSTFKIPKRRIPIEDIGFDAIPRAANGKLLRGKVKHAVLAKFAPGELKEQRRPVPAQ